MEDVIEKLLDRFENLLLRQQKTAYSLLTEEGPMKIPPETVIEIFKFNIGLLETVQEVVEATYDLDEHLIERAWMMCSEAVAWISFILMALDKSASLFLSHINIKGAPLLYTLERLAKDMQRGYRSMEVFILQDSIEDLSKVLRQQLDLTVRLYSRVV